MVERIDGPYDFRRYHWHNYADGGKYRFIAGEDFDIQPGSLIGNAREFGKRIGMKVLGTIDDGNVVVQFVAGGDDTEEESPSYVVEVKDLQYGRAVHGPFASSLDAQRFMDENFDPTDSVFIVP